MKLSEINFEDDAFKACVLATGFENAEGVVELTCRKQKIKSAAGIEYLSNLKFLDLTRNELTKIDLSKNSKLEDLFLGSNELNSINLSGCNELTYMEIFINELEELDVSSNPLLETICANKNDLESIDLSNNKELLDLRLSSNELTDIDIAANDKLTRLDLDKNPLTESVKSQLQKLESMQVQL